MAASAPGPSALDPGDILVAEFEYAKATALQANEDRARVTSYFLATAGSVAAAILGLKLDAAPSPMATLGFAGLFAALTWVGWTTLNQLAALRLAWLESCRAMNQVKAHYAAALPELAKALRWTEAKLPPAYKPGSISSQLARLVVAVLTLSAASMTIFALWSLWVITQPGAGLPSNAHQAAAALVAALVGGLTAWRAWRHYVGLLTAPQPR